MSLLTHRLPVALGIEGLPPLGRIVGGEETDVGRYEFMAGLGFGEPENLFNFCGGSLIAPNVVLTAAHCVEFLSDVDITSDNRHLDDNYEHDPYEYGHYYYNDYTDYEHNDPYEYGNYYYHHGDYEYDPYEYGHYYYNNYNDYEYVSTEYGNYYYNYYGDYEYGSYEYGSNYYGGNSIEDVTVHVGCHDLKNIDDQGTCETFAVESITIFPGYNPSRLEGDMAIVQLSGESSNNPVALAAPGLELVGGEEVTVIGWGATSEGSEGSDILMEVDVNVISDEECAEMYFEQGIDIDESMVCAADTNQDSCQGDSGGPIFLNCEGEADDVQMGVVSFGIGCARAEFPGVYADPTFQELFDFVSGEVEKLGHSVKAVNNLADVCKVEEEEEANIDYGKNRRLGDIESEPFLVGMVVLGSVMTVTISAGVIAVVYHRSRTQTKLVEQEAKKSSGGSVYTQDIKV